MACYTCEACDRLTDDDWNVGTEVYGMLICVNCMCDRIPASLEDWSISHDPKPVPTKAFDWEATHVDYDPTPIDSYGPPGDDRYFLDSSIWGIFEQIMEWEEENDYV